jgi:transposase
MTTSARLCHCDEMRFGLWGQVRRRWGRKGQKVIQRMQIAFHWSYLVLGVDVVWGELHWGWSQGMKQQQLMPILEQWPMNGVVWDGASSHRGKLMGQVGFTRIFLPAYSPELNPAERVFRELRRQVEGQVYPSLEAKRKAIEHFLRQLQADRSRLRRLICWDWLQQTMAQLPDNY